MLLGHRYYDPSAGRFVTLDPAKSGSNWNSYCEGDPLQNNDRSGLAPYNYRNHQAVLVPENVPQPFYNEFIANVDRSERLGVAYTKLALVAPCLSWYPIKEFHDLVKGGGKWDYKRQSSVKVYNRPIYEDYGNWHFGVVAAAFGFSRDFALRMAGRAQFGSTPDDWLFGSPPYGDDETDQFWIHCGYNYYEACLSKNRLLQLLCN